jgi:tRNA threonylcarbamoyladenosine biosynthesis protein TsaB
LKILALDTATEACSAAIIVDSEISEKSLIAPRRHADLILSMIDELLSDSGVALSELDAIAFGRGPGAFTGIRIAAGIVQGLAYGADLPVIPISTLAALAQGTNENSDFIISAIDARMSEIYTAIYRLLSKEPIMA